MGLYFLETHKNVPFAKRDEGCKPAFHVDFTMSIILGGSLTAILLIIFLIVSLVQHCRSCALYTHKGSPGLITEELYGHENPLVSDESTSSSESTPMEVRKVIVDEAIKSINSSSTLQCSTSTSSSEVET